MKRGIPFFLIGFLLIGSQLSFAQEVSEKTVIEKIPSPLNVVMTRPSDGTRWLLKLSPGCPTLTEGQKVGLGVRGALNGNDDYLDLGLGRRCPIKESLEFNTTVLVASTNRSRADVFDEKGKAYTLFMHQRCGDLLNWVNQELYVYRGGKKLAKGDTLLVPGEPKHCPLRVVEEVKEEKMKKAAGPEPDITSPTDVSGVRAIPRQGKVFLYWRAATDNVGVDHYLVSYSKSLIDRKHLTLNNAPDQSMAYGTNTFVEKLQNEADYYFYVLAVDAAGNTSSFWSEPSHARVKSSATADSEKQKGQGQLNLRIVQESAKSWLIKWNEPPTATRYLAALNANGKLDFSLTEYAGNQIRILKQDDRKGKKLELKVSAFNPRGFINEEKLEFEF